jgi:hypothetical protein
LKAGSFLFQLFFLLSNMATRILITSDALPSSSGFKKLVKHENVAVYRIWAPLKALRHARLDNSIPVNGKNRVGTEGRGSLSLAPSSISAISAPLSLPQPFRGVCILAFDGQPLPELAVVPYASHLLSSTQRLDLLGIPKVGRDFALE